MKRILLSLLILFSAVTAQAATTRYVKSSCTNNITTYEPTGDTCTGGSDRVYSSITNAINGGLTAAGDSIVVSAGTYAESLYCGITVCVPSGSSDSARVTLRARTGATVTIQPSSGTRVFNITGTYITIDGFIINAVNVGYGGMQIESPAHHVTVTNNEFKNVVYNAADCSGGMGINLAPTADFTVISRNSFHDFTNSTNSSCGPHAIYVTSANNTIEYNYIYNIDSYGIHQYSQHPSPPNNNIIRYNRITNTGVGSSGTVAGILCGSGSNTKIYGNITYANQDGIVAGYGASGCVIYNNTLVSNAEYGIHIRSDASGTVSSNNLSIANGSSDLYDSTTTQATNINTGTTGAHFVNAAGGDYSLISTSTAINGGTAAIASGITACANGAAPDVGAIETLGAPTATVDGVSALITVTNNCTSGMLPSTGVTGFTFKKNGSGDTVNANILSGTNSYAATLNSAFVGGDTCLFSYSQSGNSTSNNNIGNLATSNQEVLAFTDVSCTNITSGTGSVGLSHWRVYLLQGATDTAWIPKCSEDSTDCIVPPGSKLWVRNKLRNNSGTDYSAFNYRPNWRRNGGTYYPLSDGFDYGWACTNSIPPTCAVDIAGIKMIGTKGTQLGTVVSNATATTADQLTSNASNVSCSAILAASSIPSLALANSTETECAHGVEFAPTATPGDIYEMCPFTDTATALTCATPIKITIGSYQAVR